MPDPAEIDQIVHDILADIPLKEKAIIANLDEDDQMSKDAPDLGGVTGDASSAVC